MPFLHIPRFTLRTFSVFHWSFSAFHSIEAIFLHMPHAEEQIFLRIPLQAARRTVILFSVFHPPVGSVVLFATSS